jgi:hypothetical protein
MRDVLAQLAFTLLIAGQLGAVIAARRFGRPPGARAGEGVTGGSARPPAAAVAAPAQAASAARVLPIIRAARAASRPFSMKCAR